jgi:hypothetical protein
VIGDHLHRSGVITWRPLEGDTTEVQLTIRRRRTGSHARAARDLHGIFVERAAAYEAAAAASPPIEPAYRTPDNPDST